MKNFEIAAESFPDKYSHVAVRRAPAVQGEFVLSGGTDILRADKGGVRLLLRDSGVLLEEGSIAAIAPCVPYCIIGPEGETDSAEYGLVSMRMLDPSGSGMLRFRDDAAFFGRNEAESSGLSKLFGAAEEASARLAGYAAESRNGADTADTDALRLEQDAALTLLLARLFRLSAPRPLVSPSAADWDVFSGALSYVCADLGEPLTLGDIAGRANLSAYYFSHIFKEAFGETVMQFVGRLRLYKAKGMLVLGKTSVSGIASACGFLSSASFCTTFKKYYGVSPVSMRKSSSADFFRPV